MIKIGVITASDRASAGIYEDISGVAIQETMKDYLKSAHEIVYRCIPDNEVYLGLDDQVIDVAGAREFFLPYATVTSIKRANHFLQDGL